MEKFSNDKDKMERRDSNLSAGIMLAVELDSAFKLYSFRVIDRNVFISKLNELVDYYQTTRSKDLEDPLDLDVKEPETVK